jgi:hypothetical protein
VRNGRGSGPGVAVVRDSSKPQDEASDDDHARVGFHAESRISVLRSSISPHEIGLLDDSRTPLLCACASCQCANGVWLEVGGTKNA